MVEENVISLRIAVERHLKAKSRLPVRMVFRGDVFRFLFKGRGVLREGWLFLAKGDFLPKYFPPGWDTLWGVRGGGGLLKCKGHFKKIVLLVSLK